MKENIHNHSSKFVFFLKETWLEGSHGDLPKHGSTLISFFHMDLKKSGGLDTVCGVGELLCFDASPVGVVVVVGDGVLDDSRRGWWRRVVLVVDDLVVDQPWRLGELEDDHGPGEDDGEETQGERLPRLEGDERQSQRNDCRCLELESQQERHDHLLG